jgi:hypothetical protein
MGNRGRKEGKRKKFPETGILKSESFDLPEFK